MELDGDDDDDDGHWTLEDIEPGTQTDGYPGYLAARRLLEEYRNTWTIDDPAQRLDLVSLNKWILERLKLDPSTSSWSDFNGAMQGEYHKLMKLRWFLEQHAMGGPDKMLFYEATNVFFNVLDTVKHSARMLANMSPNNPDARSWMAPEQASLIDLENSNIFSHDDKEHTSFQNVFLHLLQILGGINYRRAGKSFFKCVVLANGLKANAYESACTIQEFVDDHCSYYSHYKAWKWITNPVTNYKEVINYLTERPLIEAPDLNENRHLRSYAGDEHGYGAGVYNHAQDMFYPYDALEDWHVMALRVQTVRRALFDPNYECVAPKSTDVGVIHLDSKFPFDIHEEVMSIDIANLRLTWVEVDEFECRYKPREAYEIVNAELGALLASKADEEYSVDGQSKASMPRPRVRLEAWEWVEVCGDPDGSPVTARSFARHGSRYFRVHTGFKWFDIPTPELDHIYHCQDLVDHDRYKMYSIQGRIFYKVGERDCFEGTIFTEGTGGSGKSTLVKVFQSFWPPHRRGILSANMQTQFGMESVARGDVAWCTELSEEPNMPQEDWQDATGGGSVVCPIKNKQEPLVVHRWESQFWWCSNVWPKKYKNRSGQVSRRLYGIAMYNPVKPRRDNIMACILPYLANVQRRCILAYDDWLLQQGNIDPMSDVDSLPPAFARYYHAKMRELDPVQEFLNDSKYVKIEVGEEMPLPVFRTLYNEFRQENDMGKAPRWCEEVYRFAFNENNLKIFKKAEYEWEGETMRNVDVIIGLTRT